MPYSKTVLSGVPLTKENFTSPPMEMGILPFWFWNGNMDEKEMEWQLKEYKAKGITGLFIHGRFGLKVPYVSDAWFEKVKVRGRLAERDRDRRLGVRRNELAQRHSRAEGAHAISAPNAKVPGTGGA